MTTVSEDPEHHFYVVKFYETNEFAVIPRTWIITLRGEVAYVATPDEITRSLVEYSGPHSVTWKKTYVQVEKDFENSTEAYDYLNRIINESAAVNERAESQISEPEELARKNELNNTVLSYLPTKTQTFSPKSHEKQLSIDRNPNIIILGKTSEPNMTTQVSSGNPEKKKAIPALVPITYRIRNQSEAKEFASPVRNVPLPSPPVTVEGNDSPKTEKIQISTKGTSKIIENEHILADLSTKDFNGCTENNENSEGVDHIKTIEDAKALMLKMHISLNRENPYVSFVSSKASTPKQQENIKTNNHNPIIDKMNNLPQNLPETNSENKTTPADSNVVKLNSSQKQENFTKLKIKLLYTLRKSLEDSHAAFESLEKSRNHSSMLVKEMLRRIKATRTLISESSNSTLSEKEEKEYKAAEDIAVTNQNIPGPRISPYLSIEKRGTLKYQNPKPGTIELVPGSHIYVNEKSLNKCKRVARDVKDLGRLLLHLIFTERALKTCSMSGKKADGFRKRRPGLNGPGIQALFDYVTMFTEREKKGQPGWQVNGKLLRNYVSNYITRYHDK